MISIRRSTLKNLQEARESYSLDVFYSGTSATYLPYWLVDEADRGTTEIAGGSTPLGEVLSGLGRQPSSRTLTATGFPIAGKNTVSMAETAQSGWWIFQAW